MDSERAADCQLTKVLYSHISCNMSPSCSLCFSRLLSIFLLARPVPPTHSPALNQQSASWYLSPLMHTCTWLDACSSSPGRVVCSPSVCLFAAALILRCKVCLALRISSTLLRLDSLSGNKPSTTLWSTIFLSTHLQRLCFCPCLPFCVRPLSCSLCFSSSCSLAAILLCCSLLCLPANLLTSSDANWPQKAKHKS